MGSGSVSIVHLLGMMNCIQYPSSPSSFFVSAVTTGAVIAIFSPESRDCVTTGAVILMASLAVF